MRSILDRLADEIGRSELTRYRIAQESGVAQSQLSRFVNGHGALTVESVEAVARVLGFEVVLRPMAPGRRNSK